MIGLPVMAIPDDTVTTRQLEEVVVVRTSARQRLQSVEVGAEQLQLDQLMTAPTLLGSADVVRSLQLLPGVKAESEVSSGFQVRGGTSAQNQVLYDRVPVYSVGHLAGLFSSFNADAFGAATLYKGLIPPEFGGATSAVLDIGSRSGRDNHWAGSIGVGLLSAQVMGEGPLDSLGRGTLLVAARRSYADAFLKLTDKYRDNTFYFADANVRMDWKASDKDRLQLSLFASRDRTALQDMVSLKWTNLAASLCWRHQVSTASQAQTTAYYSAYSTSNGFYLLGIDIDYSGHIRQGGLRHDLALALRHGQLDLGGQTAVIDVKSGEWQQVANHEKEQRRAWENNLWAAVTLSPSSSWTVRAGLRLTSFSSLGGPYYYDTDSLGNIVWFYRTRRNHIVHTRLMLEPRLSIVWKPAELVSLKAAYSRTAQNIHALRGQTTSTPFDRYALSSNLLHPEEADQLSLGLYAMTPRQDYDFTLEGYWRAISHVLDYRDGKSFASEIEMERLVLAGRGRCYGVELLARRNSGPLQGWLAYTLSWSRNQIDGINGGRWYTAGNDRRHDVDVVALWQVSPSWRLSATWIYTSGQAFTAPSAKYQLIDNYIYYYAERNGYRAPAYHRLDLGATWTHPLAGGRIERQWQFGIYNAYNRYNPFLISFEDSNLGANTRAVGYSLFGIVPSISLNLKF